MLIQVLHCPSYRGTDIVKYGISPEGTQRYRCRACLQVIYYLAAPRRGDAGTGGIIRYYENCL